jgi:hypothetical protein
MPALSRFSFALLLWPVLAQSPCPADEPEFPAELVAFEP